MNDTGAIAYFGGHSTFDIVGLTTREEGRYWVAGPASRLEHYERLRTRSPERLPTHFIVYPTWLGLDALLGEPLKEATVTDSTILGGQTMIAYVADWSALGTGEKPWTAGARGVEPLDSVDVADLESEAEHEYELLGARDGDEVVRNDPAPDGRSVIDGGRSERTTERFSAHLCPGAPAHAIVRLEGPRTAAIHVLAGGEPTGEFDLGDAGGAWVERTFDVPRQLASARTHIELRMSGGHVTVFHYWFMPSP
ncbi:MAG: hypothetical protein ABSC94_14665 [Polyangiaceae bacterium]